ncbi:Response regulator rcp1 [Caulifigura coniformis]|uniref:Response regulator rcp1 n=1 Tax=Caulifigura coniformis TaxID=2527983 RepID=A0A517SB73_9PLAN|nr:response regulator [Caulifigura coniformis]QDT53383.1 Response regulator rcp1 [Caulifigura coniformis]
MPGHTATPTRPFDVLLVEDSPSDAELTRKAFQRQRVDMRLHHVWDGIECLNFLGRVDPFKEAPRPDLILLDLNMPRMDGREVLRKVKGDQELCPIPIVVLTTGGERSDILEAYREHANAYVIKPVDLERFFSLVGNIRNFWMQTVELPNRG